MELGVLVMMQIFKWIVVDRNSGNIQKVKRYMKYKKTNRIKEEKNNKKTKY